MGPRGPRASADARVRYLSTASLFITYEDGPLLSSRAEPRRALALGVSDDALAGGPLRGASDRAGYFTLVLGWQQLFGSPVVDLGDRRPSYGR